MKVCKMENNDELLAVSHNCYKRTSGLQPLVIGATNLFSKFIFLFLQCKNKINYTFTFILKYSVSLSPQLKNKNKKLKGIRLYLQFIIPWRVYSLSLPCLDLHEKWLFQDWITKSGPCRQTCSSTNLSYWVSW